MVDYHIQETHSSVSVVRALPTRQANRRLRLSSPNNDVKDLPKTRPGKTPRTVFPNPIPAAPKRGPRCREGRF